MNKWLERSLNIKEEIIRYRRELHKIPELGFELQKTAQTVEEILGSMGIESIRCAGTGVVAVLEGKNPDGPVIGIRADMDAMPVNEETEAVYASMHEGVMHCCGHDAHTAMLLGTAKLLKENKEQWNGRVKLIFQPAEEIVSGAKRMIDERVLENPKVDMVVGLHVWQPLANGKLGIKKGTIMASANNFHITIKGKSAHGAMPYQGIDPIAASADFIQGVQHMLTRVIPTTSKYVLSFCKINGGIKDNVIAAEVKMEGTFRTFDLETRDQVERTIKTYLDSKVATHGIEWEYGLNNSAPPNVNDGDLTESVKGALVQVVGGENVVEYGPVLPAEDFAEYGLRVPAAFFFLGTGNDQIIYPHHHSKFEIDENILPVGAAAFAQIVTDLTA